MNFLKKILIAIILITVIAAGWTLSLRVEEVDQSSGIEIILDGEKYLELKSIEPQIDLKQLKEKGVSTLAVYQQSLEDFEDNGSLKRIEALDIVLGGNELKTQLQDKGININQLDNSALFAVFNNSLQKQLNNLSAELESEYSADFFSAADYNFIYFPNWHDKLEDLSLGYNENLVNTAREAGLKIAYRSGNKLNSLSALEKSVELLSPEILIFDGEEVSGYPAQIEKTAEVMQENNLIFGNIEAFIADQDGSEKLARLNDFQLLRTHSMQQEEVEQADNKKIIDRYLLSVRERSVRLLYHKPYLKGDQLAQKNLELLDSLQTELIDEGYTIGNADPVDYFSTSNWNLLVVLLGVTAAGILMLNYFTSFKFARLMNLFFLISAAAAFLLLQTGRGILLRQITALGAAVIFPSLAVIILLLNKEKGGEDLEGGYNFFYLFINYTAAVLTAFIGGVFVSSALNSSEFIFKVYDFRGVKIAFLMPLLIISLYYLFQPGTKDLKKEIPNLLERVIKVKHIILAGGLALIAVIYIGRTGNFPLLPVPAWELTLRSLLEKILYVRPRFKEFLIGHPFFIFALYLSIKKRSKLYFYPILMLASVGVITTVNTFSHLHTPIMVSVLRTFHSYWLGLIIGALLIMVYRYANNLYQKYYIVE